MKVTALRRGRAKGQPPERLDHWRMEAGEPGDERQLSLLPREAREAVERMGKRGLCMERFFANVEIAAFSPPDPGERLAVGEAVLEVTRAEKRCFPACGLAREGTACPLKACRFARVVRGGEVSPGSRVFLLSQDERR